MGAIIGLATIVGLLSDFVAEGRARDADAWEQFRLELDSKRHKRLIDELDSNTELSTTIKNMLQSNNDELNQTLEAINNSLAELVSASGLNEIAEVFSPNHYLSAGAIGIIVTMERMQSKSITESKTMSGTKYRVNGGRGGAFRLEKENERYADDDFNSLLKLGLLREDYTQRGNKLFHMTRNASALAQSYMNKDDVTS